MKTIATALASAALLGAVLPAPALAQSHGASHASGGGGHYGGGYHGGSGGYHGGYRGGGDDHGGYYRGGGYRHDGGYPYAIGGLGLGLFLGSAFASPSYYDYPVYSGYSGYSGYSSYPGYYESVEPVAPPYAYDAPRPRARAPQACGAWKWDPAEDRYFWIPC